MNPKTIEARLNAITNCMAVFDEMQQSLFFSTNAIKKDIEAHKWLYKLLCELESKYKSKNNIKNKSI